jgi:hypothetical protein
VLKPWRRARAWCRDHSLQCDKDRSGLPVVPLESLTQVIHKA